MENVTRVIQLIPLNYYVLLSTMLFSIGVIGVLFRRNAIVIFMCVELMLNAVNLLLAAFFRLPFGPGRAGFCILYYGSSSR